MLLIPKSAAASVAARAVHMWLTSHRDQIAHSLDPALRDPPPAATIALDPSRLYCGSTAYDCKVSTVRLSLVHCPQPFSRCAATCAIAGIELVERKLFKLGPAHSCSQFGQSRRSTCR